MESEFHSVKASCLKLGSVLKFPVKDDNDMLLLADGHTITEAFFAKLKARGIISIRVHESELPRICAGEPQGTASTAPINREGVVCPLRNEGSEKLDDELAKTDLGVPQQGDPFALQLQKHANNRYDAKLKDQIAVRWAADVGKLADVLKSLVDGRGLDLTTLADVTDAGMKQVAEDSDLIACIGANPFASSYPARHSLHVSMLALLVGTRLKLDETTLKELAIGCLVHDSCMMKLKKSMYASDKILDPVDFLEITKHPVMICDLIKDVRSVSNRSGFIAYQIHERCDGSGYPRRRTAPNIHFLSKVAGVVDNYVALVSPRPHRPAMLPYHAMKKTLYEVKQGLFDATAVKALLHTLSLFPLGSYVELDSGEVGRVIRSNGDSYTRPVLEVWDKSRLDAPPRVLNLLESEAEIVRPLAELEVAA